MGFLGGIGKGGSVNGKVARFVLIGLLGFFIFVVLLYFSGLWGGKEKPVALKEVKPKAPAAALQGNPAVKNAAVPPVPAASGAAQTAKSAGAQQPTVASPTPAFSAAGAPQSTGPALEASKSAKKEDETLRKGASPIFAAGATQPAAGSAGVGGERQRGESSATPAKARPAERSNAGEVRRYTIQVAALDVEKPARRLAAKLHGEGFPSYVVEAHPGDNTTIYRVRVGHYGSLPEAKRVAELLHERERLSFFIALTQG